MWHQGPFAVPIAAFMMIVALNGIKAFFQYRVRKLQSAERIAAIERGVALPPEAPVEIEEQRTRTWRDRVRKSRLGGIVCVSVGLGLIVFLGVIAVVEQERDVISGAAAGIIPLAIGIGLLIDARFQQRSGEAEDTAASSYRAQSGE